MVFPAKHIMRISKVYDSRFICVTFVQFLQAISVSSVLATSNYRWLFVSTSISISISISVSISIFPFPFPEMDRWVPLPEWVAAPCPVLEKLRIHRKFSQGWHFSGKSRRPQNHACAYLAHITFVHGAGFDGQVVLQEQL